MSETKEYCILKLHELEYYIDSEENSVFGIKGVAVKNGDFNKFYIKKKRFSPDQRNFEWLKYLKENIDNLPYKLFTIKPNGKNIYIVKKDKLDLFKKKYSEAIEKFLI